MFNRKSRENIYDGITTAALLLSAALVVYMGWPEEKGAIGWAIMLHVALLHIYVIEPRMRRNLDQGSD